MPDPIFNPANDKSIPLTGDLWVITNDGVVAGVCTSAIDATEMLKRALQVTTQPGYTSGCICVYYAKKGALFPLPTVTVGARFTPEA